MSESHLLFSKGVCQGLRFVILAENFTLSLDQTDGFLDYLTILFQLQSAYNIELEIIVNSVGVRIWK
jgi:hypothetical protein